MMGIVELGNVFEWIDKEADNGSMATLAVVDSFATSQGDYALAAQARIASFNIALERLTNADSQQDLAEQIELARKQHHTVAGSHYRRDGKPNEAAEQFELAGETKIAISQYLNANNFGKAHQLMLKSDSHFKKGIEGLLWQENYLAAALALKSADGMDEYVKQIAGEVFVRTIYQKTLEETRQRIGEKEGKEPKHKTLEKMLKVRAVDVSDFYDEDFRMSMDIACNAENSELIAIARDINNAMLLLEKYHPEDHERYDVVLRAQAEIDWRAKISVFAEAAIRRPYSKGNEQLFARRAYHLCVEHDWPTKACEIAEHFFGLGDPRTLEQLSKVDSARYLETLRELNRPVEYALAVKGNKAPEGL